MFTVALLSPPYASLTYSAPPWLPESVWQPGLRVAVPLGNGAVRAAVLLGPAEADALPPGVLARPLLWPLEREPLLPLDYMELVHQMATRQLVTEGRILGTLLPAGMRTTSRIRVREFQQGKPKMHALRDLARLDEAALCHLGAGWNSAQVEVLALKEDSASTELCQLAQDPPWSVLPNAVRQRAVLDYLLAHGSVSRRRLHDAVPESKDCLPSLLKRSLVRLVPFSEENNPEAGLVDDNELALLPPPDPPFQLSPEQESALSVFLQALEAQCSTTHLLFGITGSGKTAIYLELARHCLSLGRSALLLAPEVALAYKLRRDVQQRFPGLPIFLFHGYQSAPQREECFRQLAQRREPCLVIGTRSALFLPVPSLGLIILDEEHDSSFKQDEGLSYQAKEVAWFRAAQHQALLLLGSATPDLKTFHAAQHGHMPISRLSERVGGGTLPAIELIDIHDSATMGLLEGQSLEALKENLIAGNQSVVLLNRRGYAPRMYCLDCKTVARCPHCDIALTYHKGREQMICHYCGYTRSFPSPCTQCRGLHFLPMGEGTEKLEEQLTPLLPPGGRVLRLDRDTTSRPGRMEEILAQFARQEAQILVGTQMLSKGHHFPHVTLAVIADGDLGLNIPDYRAAERTFQLLLQSAGRAGRGSKPGRVLIQTRDTRHYCWNFIQNADYEGFYAHEIALREKRRYPPFVKLALVRLSYPFDWPQGLSHINTFAQALKQAGRPLNVTILGPAPAPLMRLNGRLRYHCLLKADSWQHIRAAFSRALPQPQPQNLRIALDIDPVNML